MGVNPVKVLFTFVDANGNKGTQEVYMQKGIEFNFGGATYKVTDKGVQSSTGDMIAQIQVERDKLDALMGMSQLDNTDNLPGDSRAFVLSEKDIATRFNLTDENVDDLNFKVNQRLQLHDSSTRTHWDNVDRKTGEAWVELYGQEKSIVRASSEQSRAEAKENERLDEAYAKKHYIRSFFGVTRQEYERNNPRDY